MRVLLDSCVPKRLAKELIEHEVQTAQKMGWGDLDDGPLLNAIDGSFDVLVTVDKSLPKQQRLNNRPFRLADLLPHVPALRLAIEELRPGQVRELAG